MSVFRAFSLCLLLLALIIPSLASGHRTVSGSLGELSKETLKLVEDRLAETATDTWVSGTHAQALLELHYPSLSVFSAAYAFAFDDPEKVRNIVDYWSAKRQNNSKELAHVDGGAAGDPPSLGVAWLVVSQQTSDWSLRGKLWEEAFQQVEYLLEDVPRTQDKAISHRPPTEPVQLWSDFVYMVPPFLAYSGVVSHNMTLLQEAYKQCKLYRQYLKSADSGALQHVVLGDWQDKGLWATGNAWAAAGMARVIATLQNSIYASLLSEEIKDLKLWTNEILEASFSVIQADGLVLNYYGNSTSFTDSASSSLLAATAFRLAILDTDVDYSATIESASIFRSAVNERVDRSTGWLTGAVDPLAWKQQTYKSPESQAFVLLLESAWRDYRLSTRKLLL